MPNYHLNKMGRILSLYAIWGALLLSAGCHKSGSKLATSMIVSIVGDGSSTTTDVATDNPVTLTPYRIY